MKDAEPSDIGRAERVSEARNTSQDIGSRHRLTPPETATISRTTRHGSTPHKMA